VNQVALVGNIIDDPELRYTQNGAALAGFTIAVSHRSKHNGEWQDVNDGFFRCTARRSVAENAPQHPEEGHARLRCWVFEVVRSRLQIQFGTLSYQE
jgi:single stranded DNA-binding protein